MCWLTKIQGISTWLQVIREEKRMISKGNKYKKDDGKKNKDSSDEKDKSEIERIRGQEQQE